MSLTSVLNYFPPEVVSDFLAMESVRLEAGLVLRGLREEISASLPSPVPGMLSSEWLII